MDINDGTVMGLTHDQFQSFMGQPVADWQWKVLRQLAGDPNRAYARPEGPEEEPPF